MMAFDTSTREVCTARRSPTNTPLQALVLLNDIQFVEASRVLAGLALKQPAIADTDKVKFLFLRLASREPTPSELVLLTQLVVDQRAQFAKDPSSALKFVSIGETKVDPKLDPVELAATTVLAQTILNLDATVWKR